MPDKTDQTGKTVKTTVTTIVVFVALMLIVLIFVLWAEFVAKSAHAQSPVTANAIVRQKIHPTDRLQKLLQVSNVVVVGEVVGIDTCTVDQANKYNPCWIRATVEVTQVFHCTTLHCEDWLNQHERKLQITFAASQSPDFRDLPKVRLGQKAVFILFEDLGNLPGLYMAEQVQPLGRLNVIQDLLGSIEELAILVKSSQLVIVGRVTSIELYASIIEPVEVAADIYLVKVAVLKTYKGRSSKIIKVYFPKYGMNNYIKQSPHIPQIGEDTIMILEKDSSCFETNWIDPSNCFAVYEPAGIQPLKNSTQVRKLLSPK